MTHNPIIYALLEKVSTHALLPVYLSNNMLI